MRLFDFAHVGHGLVAAGHHLPTLKCTVASASGRTTFAPYRCRPLTMSSKPFSLRVASTLAICSANVVAALVPAMMTLPSSV